MLFLLIFSFSFALFPGAIPDEGDYRHLYGKVCVTLRIFETPYIFPYSMGRLENLRYPKDRMHLQLLAEQDSILTEQIKKLVIGALLKLLLF
jgi:hypothetical protein